MKKYNGTAWVDTTLRQYKTSTDTLTTLPADLYADGTNATVGLVGNMEQNGSPTPQTPIAPSECGDLETTGEHAGQYKIPISSASTTTPVYLGEVETTRRIRKYELTGTETPTTAASITSTNAYQFRNDITDYEREAFICSHMPVSNSSSGSGTHGYIGTYLTLCFDKAMGLDTTDKVQAYLAQQYANGTPVCVWYVLATPETAVVNEPIRKIGDYADSVSGISIPTITGADSFDVLTTLKPSEVELTYTGWHDASAKEWDGSDWQ